MKQLRLLLFLGWSITAWAVEGIIGFPKLAADPNDVVVEKKAEEPNVVELVDIEPVGAIHLTPACDIPPPKYYLLPLKTELTDAESLPLFLDIFRKDPNHPELEPDFDLIDQLLKKSAEKTDLAVFQELLAKHAEKLNLLRKASRCKTVEWPVTHYEPGINHMSLDMPGIPGVSPKIGNISTPNTPDKIEEEYKPAIFNPSEYLDFLNDIRQYGKLIALKARYHILTGDYDTATEWLRTGLSISRQMVRNSNSQLGVTAAANAAVILQQIELWVQMPDAPGLYRSLQDMPLPFLNASSLSTLVQKKPKQIMPPDMFGMPGMPGMGMPMPEKSNPTEEKENVLPDYSTELFQGTSARIDRFIAILQCLEGLRYYAALYNGQLPNSLGEVTEIRLPTDPVTKRGFLYYKESDAAILQTSDMNSDVSPSGFHYTIRMRPFSRD